MPFVPFRPSTRMTAAAPTPSSLTPRRVIWPGTGWRSIYYSSLMPMHSSPRLPPQESLKLARTSAEQTTHIHVADGAILEYIPPYVIPFAGSRFRQRATIHMEEGSTCLSLDWFSTGRISRGENLAFEEYENSTMVICGGKPIVFDRFVLRPQDEDYSALGRMESYTVSALLSSGTRRSRPVGILLGRHERPVSGQGCSRRLKRPLLKSSYRKDPGSEHPLRKEDSLSTNRIYKEKPAGDRG